ncbi:Hypothetical protein CINCED_3A015894 [Cinara cedri]|uniref:Uncharacterized protein n=1 Tax=Cinara cedri TaxID=506608 RepID=A0A5E4MTI2_9HEMI|nr:Hypothetical protein CINCED_3A015894 [Cinara cedri]
MEQSVDDDCSIINVLDLAAPPSGQTAGQPSTSADSRTLTARRACKSMTLEEADVMTARKRFAEMTANSRYRWSDDSSNCHENGSHCWPDDVSNATAEDGSRRWPDDVSNATAKDGSRRWTNSSNVAAEDGRNHGSSAAEYGPYRWSDDFNADYRRYRWSDEFNPKSTDSTEASTVDFDTASSVAVDAPATLTAHVAPSSAVQFTNAHTPGVRPNTRLVGASAMLAAASAFTFAPAELHGALNENDFGHPHTPPSDVPGSTNRTQRDNNKDGPSIWTRSKECVTNCFVNAIRRVCFCEW